jgi:hypothetical protein
MAHLSQSTSLVTDHELDLPKVITKIPASRQCWLIIGLVVHLRVEVDESRLTGSDKFNRNVKRDGDNVLEGDK